MNALSNPRVIARCGFLFFKFDTLRSNRRSVRIELHTRSDVAKLTFEWMLPSLLIHD